MDKFGIIPNPLDKNSKLSDLAQKGIVIKEGLSFNIFIRNFISLIVLSIVLNIYYKVPLPIILLLIGTHVLVSFVAGYIKVQKIKSLRNIESGSQANDYRRLLITNEYYEVVKAIFGILANLLSLFVLFTFFGDALKKFVNNIFSIYSINPNLLLYALVFFSSFQLVTRIIRYILIKKIKESDELAEVNRQYVLMNKKLEILNIAPIAGVILMMMYVFSVPTMIIGFVALFLILFVGFSVVEIVRINRVDLSTDKIDKTVVKHNISFIPDEKNEAAIFGILTTAVDMKGVFKVFGSSSLGVGKIYNPENTLLITNKRLLFIQVPLTGGNKIVDQTDYVTQNFLYNRGELREKGEQLLKEKTPQQLLEYATSDVVFSDIKTVTLEKAKIIIEKNNGEKFAYAYLDKEYLDILKVKFKEILGDRLTESI